MSRRTEWVVRDSRGLVYGGDGNWRFTDEDDAREWARESDRDCPQDAPHKVIKRTITITEEEAK